MGLQFIWWSTRGHGCCRVWPLQEGWTCGICETPRLKQPVTEGAAQCIQCPWGGGTCCSTGMTACPKLSCLPPLPCPEDYPGQSWPTLVPSCWNRKGTSPNCSHNVGSIKLSKMSWYAETLRVPFTETKGQSPTLKKQTPHLSPPYTKLYPISIIWRGVPILLAINYTSDLNKARSNHSERLLQEYKYLFCKVMVLTIPQTSFNHIIEESYLEWKKLPKVTSQNTTFMLRVLFLINAPCGYKSTTKNTMTQVTTKIFFFN